MGQKSDQGIKLLAGIRVEAVVLARESAISLPKIPVGLEPRELKYVKFKFNNHCI